MTGAKLSNFVFYDETDCGGIMYHANYITICERARSFLFFQKDSFPYINNDCTEGFVVKHIESEFIAPLRLGDFYEVTTQVENMKNTSLILKQDIFKLKEIGKEVEKPQHIFSAKIVLVYIDSNKKPKKIPSILRDVF